MRFRGVTEECEVVEFKIYCEDYDEVTEYGSEIGVHQGIWNYVKKDTLVCLEVEDLERQLDEAGELLLQIQDHMSQLSTHTHDGWSGSCAETVYEMIEKQLKEKGDEKK